MGEDDARGKTRLGNIAPGLSGLSSQIMLLLSRQCCNEVGNSQGLIELATVTQAARKSCFMWLMI